MLFLSRVCFCRRRNVIPFVFHAWRIIDENVSSTKTSSLSWQSLSSKTLTVFLFFCCIFGNEVLSCRSSESKGSVTSFRPFSCRCLSLFFDTRLLLSLPATSFLSLLFFFPFPAKYPDKAIGCHLDKSYNDNHPTIFPSCPSSWLSWSSMLILCLLDFARKERGSRGSFSRSRRWWKLNQS